jgi:hypothetical protein
MPCGLVGSMFIKVVKGYFDICCPKIFTTPNQKCYEIFHTSGNLCHLKFAWMNLITFPSSGTRLIDSTGVGVIQ